VFIFLISVSDAPSVAPRILAQKLEGPGGKLHVAVTDVDLRLLGGRWHAERVAGWGEQLDEVVGRVDEMGPQIVGLSCTLWNAEVVREICDRLRRLWPALTVVVWGMPGSLPGAHMSGVQIPEGADLVEQLCAVAGTAPGAVEEGTTGFSGERIDELVRASNRFGMPITVEPLSGAGLPLHLHRANNLPPPRDRLGVAQAVAWLGPLLRSGLTVRLADPTLTAEREGLDGLLERLPPGRLALELPVELLEGSRVERLLQLRPHQLDLDLTHLADGRLDPARVRSVIQPLLELPVHLRGLLVYGLPGQDHAGFGQAVDRCLLAGIEDLRLTRLVVPTNSPLRGEPHLVVADSPPFEVLCHPRTSAAAMLRCVRLAAVFDLIKESLVGTGVLRALCESAGSAFDLVEGFAESLVARDPGLLMRPPPRPAERMFAEYLRTYHGIDLEAGQGQLRLVRSPALSLRWLGDGSRLVTDEATGRVAHLGRGVLALIDRCDHAQTIHELCEQLVAESPPQRRDRLRRDLRITIDKLATMGFLVPHLAGEAPSNEAPFTGLDEFDYHYRMLKDHRRVEAYRQAIEQVVRPGQHVVEVGTGTGILAVLAARAGARVTAIERYAVLEIARAMAQRSGVADRITFVRGRSDLVQLEEPADVLLSELVGNRILNEGLLEVSLDARRRLLREGAELIPRRITVVAELGRTDRFERTAQRLLQIGTSYGVSMEPLVQWLQTSTGAGQLVWESGADEEDLELLSGEHEVIELDLREIRQPSFTTSFAVTPLTAAEANVVVLSFRLELLPGIMLSTQGPRHPLHWNKPVFMLPAPIPVQPGLPVPLQLAYETGGEIRVFPPPR
jgi:hypothetical protein